MITGRSGTLAGAGVFSAIAASLCCIVPILGLIAGTSNLATNFSWIAPARPYLIGLSIAVLGFAWYLKLKPLKNTDMDCCDTSEKDSFWQTRTFLSIITVITALMIAFPLYAKVFYPKNETTTSVIINAELRSQVKFTILGMTCESCELEVDIQLSKVKGVLSYKTSYETRSSLVKFDNSVVDIPTIVNAISKTGYKVKSHEIIRRGDSWGKEEKCETDAGKCTSECKDGTKKSCCKENQ